MYFTVCGLRFCTLLTFCVTFLLGAGLTYLLPNGSKWHPKSTIGSLWPSWAPFWVPWTPFWMSLGCFGRHLVDFGCPCFLPAAGSLGGGKFQLLQEIVGSIFATIWSILLSRYQGKPCIQGTHLEERIVFIASQRLRASGGLIALRCKALIRTWCSRSPQALACNEHYALL